MLKGTLVLLQEITRLNYHAHRPAEYGHYVSKSTSRLNKLVAVDCY